MTHLLPTTALRAAAAALARAGAGSALTALVLLVLASSVRMDLPDAAAGGRPPTCVSASATAVVAAASKACERAAGASRCEEISFLCRSSMPPALHVQRGSLPPTRAP